MDFLEIKKSKFIPLLIDIKKNDELKNILVQLRQKHKKARHIVYAYIIKDNNNFMHGFSDDKEPKGVAGIPLYTLLVNKEIYNKLLVVIRYYGGIELGKSNLLRAYLQAAKLIIK
ncbi:YigZ family protein [Metamycoplasma alkalescens]|uniref:YigZ family protein n=1 Tax=Metamycoplasma alkalescens TaxID=45363 RepID=UPI003CFE4318